METELGEEVVVAESGNSELELHGEDGLGGRGEWVVAGEGVPRWWVPKIEG